MSKEEKTPEELAKESQERLAKENQERLAKENQERLAKEEKDRKEEFEKRQAETDKDNAKLVAESDEHLKNVREPKKDA